MPGELPIARLLGEAADKIKRKRAALAHMVGINRDARELFLDDKGALRPAAVRLFAQLAREARINRLEFIPDARLQDNLLGRQHMVKFLTKMLRLDVARLHQLQHELGDDK